jgi:amino acid transporter, AAT family
MNFVLLTAVLSAANSGIYATSRTLYSMAQNGEAPKKLLKVTKHGIPINGISITSICILIGVFLAYMTPEQIISYMMTIPGFTILLIWTAICLSQLKLRRHYKEKPFFQVRGFPYTTILAVVSLSIIFIYFMFNKNNIIGSSVCLVILVILTVLAFLSKDQSDKN